MDAQNLYQIILDQREELAAYQGQTYVMRREAEQLDFDSKLAQVVIGVRRSGKSTLCHTALQARGFVYGYVNFDDDRLAHATVEDLNDVLEAVYRVYGVELKYLLLDEIQNVEGWHLFVNRLLRQGMHVVVTGSNAKLLSSELATHLTGRYHEVRLYPFSFRDFCLARQVPLTPPITKNVSLQMNALQDYLIEGGFPELQDVYDRQGYVTGVIHTIINKDIKVRFKLRNAQSLNLLAQHLMNQVGQVVNVSDLSERLGIGTNKTVRTYIDYLTQAFLILPLHKFSYKSRERLIQEKAYLIDTGVLSYHEQAPMSDNLGWRLENVVMMELLRRTKPNFEELYYYKPTAKDREVDFVVTDRGRVAQLIQVSWDVSQPKTLIRELKALSEAAQKLNCENLTLIAMTQSRTEKMDGHEIRVVAAHEWLLETGRS
jgi:predicted AAA+ superfamily ATPase